MSEVIVVGGGAAGMMAAYAAAVNGHHVTLLEKNEKLGKKVYITGKGRCNVTNAGETAEFFGKVVRNPKSLYSAVYSFDASAAAAFMEENGCRLKIERGNRVFPVSDHASDIIRACERALKRAGVSVRLHTKVAGLLTVCGSGEDAMRQGNGAGQENGAGLKGDMRKKNGAGPKGDMRQENGADPKGDMCKKNGAGKKECRIAGVRLADGGKLRADAVIVATGGLSYPSTGSDGDGLCWAERMGIAVEACRPALVPLTVKEDWCGRLQGLSLKNVAVSLQSGKRTLYSEQGEMLFTHFGVSGPLILSASSYYADAYAGAAGRESGEARLWIDLKPALSEEQLDQRLLREFEANKNRQFVHAVERLFPSKLIPVIVELSGIPPKEPVHDITRKQRLCFVRLIKRLTLTVTGTRGFAEAVITQGGVCVKEIDPSTMESRRIGGLYFAGEILDTDALTGGYNLQIAWSTGHLAGDSIPRPAG